VSPSHQESPRYRRIVHSCSDQPLTSTSGLALFHLTEEGGETPRPPSLSFLALGMDQRLNSLGENEAAINALIRAESNMPRLSEELTKPLHVTPAAINDPVVAEITEHKRTDAGANLRHKVARDDGTTKQRIRLTLRQARLPDVAALVVLQLPERQDGRVISQPHGTTTVRTP